MIASERSVYPRVLVNYVSKQYLVVWPNIGGHIKNNVCMYYFISNYLHLPLTFLKWAILDQLTSYTDKDQLLMWRRP